MSNINTNFETSFRPGSYGVELVHLYTNLNLDDQYIDLTYSANDIKISESIYSMGISLDVTIADARGLLESFKIMGNEKIHIKIFRKDIVSKEKKQYDLMLRLADISNYSRVKDGMQVYTFTCVSDFVYHNNLRTLTTNFEGSIGDVIKKICVSVLKINNNNLSISTETKNAKGIFPRLKPLSAIKWLLQNITDNNTPFFFYERISDNKVVLESLKDIIDKEVYDEYEFSPFFNDDIAKSEDPLKAYEEERKKIKKLSSDLDISKLRSIADGCYGSTLHTIDIAEKKYEKSSFTYKRNHKLNKFDPVSDNMKFLDKSIKEHVEGKNFFISQNSLAYGNNLKNYNSVLSINYLNAYSYFKNLKNITIDIDIHGDFDLKLGDKISLNVNRAGSDSKEDPKDKYLSGNFIISRIEHSFSEDYTMSLMLQKDSFIEDINDILKIENRETT